MHYLEIFKKHQITRKTSSLLKTQNLLQSSVPIIKQQILINITTFSDYFLVNSCLKSKATNLLKHILVSYHPIWHHPNWELSWLVCVNFQESLSKRYNGIESCAMFKHAFTFKIKKYYCNFKRKSLTTVSTV